MEVKRPAAIQENRTVGKMVTAALISWSRWKGTKEFRIEGAHYRYDIGCKDMHAKLFTASSIMKDLWEKELQRLTEEIEPMGAGSFVAPTQITETTGGGSFAAPVGQDGITINEQKRRIEFAQQHAAYLKDNIEALDQKMAPRGHLCHVFAGWTQDMKESYIDGAYGPGVRPIVYSVQQMRFYTGHNETHRCLERPKLMWLLKLPRTDTQSNWVKTEKLNGKVEKYQ